MHNRVMSSARDKSITPARSVDMDTKLDLLVLEVELDHETNKKHAVLDTCDQVVFVGSY